LFKKKEGKPPRFVSRSGGVEGSVKGYARSKQCQQQLWMGAT